MIFPLVAAVPVVVIDGKVVRSYVAARLEKGRIVAPLEPFVTAVATRIAYEGSTIVIYRGDRFAQVRVRSQPIHRDLQTTFVPLATVLRTLGETVSYDPVRDVLVAKSPTAPMVTPTPFNPSVPEAPKQTVFTPSPLATPRPVFTGRPVPRRTPLPVRTTPRP